MELNRVQSVSIILPAKNESAALTALLPQLRQQFSEWEIIVVDDGSTDDTIAVCNAHRVTVISHPYSMGNGAAIKSGARAAKGDIFVFMDADGQHQPQDIARLLEPLSHGYDMVVGARDRQSQAGAHRAFANGFYNRLSSWVVGHSIKDLTSGFRAVKAAKFRKFLYLLPNGFSYPTTITMSFFRAGFTVAYVPIVAPKRIGRSHVRIVRDGVRFLLIIFKIGTLHSPLKIFLPVSLSFFIVGLGHYLYTLITVHRLTNMSVLLVIAAMMTFLMGLMSEQITSLNYKDSE
ncbi:MAG TPA: glycosyltransferase family 2 protein [Burkholderiaceae bacterium]|jgi:glycosyltransferase involved in cell wall biosynthesis|nr:glycosyltransferase family 2 protein [Burkholderiaceae bacterium]